MDWTPEAISTLTELWNCNAMSASAIARTMGATRNAIIGKAHRLQLVSREGKPTVNITKPRSRQRVIRIKMTNIENQQPIPDEPEVQPVPVEYHALQYFHCRAIVDGVGSDGLVLSCGRRKINGSSYCEMHTRISSKDGRPTGKRRAETGRLCRNLDSSWSG